jgi:hypothetical protein
LIDDTQGVLVVQIDHDSLKYTATTKGAMMISEITPITHEAKCLECPYRTDLTRRMAQAAGLPPVAEGCSGQVERFEVTDEPAALELPNEHADSRICGKDELKAVS